MTLAEVVCRWHGGGCLVGHSVQVGRSPPPPPPPIDQSVTPFSAALFSALITHKNWLVLSGVYAGIILSLFQSCLGDSRDTGARIGSCAISYCSLRKVVPK